MQKRIYSAKANTSCKQKSNKYVNTVLWAAIIYKKIKKIKMDRAWSERCLILHSGLLCAFLAYISMVMINGDVINRNMDIWINTRCIKCVFCDWYKSYNLHMRPWVIGSEVVILNVLLNLTEKLSWFVPCHYP